MPENKLKHLLQQGKPVVNAWLTIPCAFTAELFSHSGYDALTLDMQHGLIGYEAAAKLAKDAFVTGKTIRELCREKGILPEATLQAALDPMRMTEPQR